MIQDDLVKSGYDRPGFYILLYAYNNYISSLTNDSSLNKKIKFMILDIEEENIKETKNNKQTE